MRLPRPKLIQLDQIRSDSGTITVAESGKDFDFSVARVYLIHSTSADSTRGRHAHKELEQLLIAAVGSFRVHVEFGGRSLSFRLESPDVGLLLPPMAWRTIDQFSEDAVCLVLASDVYREEDYIRSYSEYSSGQ